MSINTFDIDTDRLIWFENNIGICSRLNLKLRLLYDESAFKEIHVTEYIPHLVDQILLFFFRYPFCKPKIHIKGQSDCAFYYIFTIQNTFKPIYFMHSHTAHEAFCFARRPIYSNTTTSESF